MRFEKRFFSRIANPVVTPKSQLVAHAATAGNALVAIAKFAAARWTGSSANRSEAIHSVADTGIQVPAARRRYFREA